MATSDPGGTVLEKKGFVPVHKLGTFGKPSSGIVEANAACVLSQLFGVDPNGIGVGLRFGPYSSTVIFGWQVRLLHFATDEAVASLKLKLSRTPNDDQHDC